MISNFLLDQYFSYLQLLNQYFPYLDMYQNQTDGHSHLVFEDFE